MRSPEDQLVHRNFANRFLLGAIIFVAVISEAEAVYRLFFNPGMAGRGMFDYLTLLLLPLPVLLAIVSRRQTKRWIAAGDMSPTIAAEVDSTVNFVAMFSYLIMPTIGEMLR